MKTQVRLLVEECPAEYIRPYRSRIIRGTDATLAATQEGDDSSWSVTHVATGYAFPPFFDDRKDAEAFGVSVFRVAKRLCRLKTIAGIKRNCTDEVRRKIDALA